MSHLPDNVLHLTEYQVLNAVEMEDGLHFHIDAPDPVACEECGAEGEFVPDPEKNFGVDLSTFWED